MEKAKRARKAETPKQPSPCLRLRAPYLYPDPGRLDIKRHADRIVGTAGVPPKADRIAAAPNSSGSLPANVAFTQ